MLLRNRYRVIERLGAGAMGSVYAVHDLRAGGARIALKAMWLRGEGADGRLVASLREEFRVLAALDDPRLGRAYDYGRLPPGQGLDGAPADAAGGYFLTRELIDGRDLAAEAAAGGRSVPLVCGLVAQAARACDVLHRAGLRHGDFKPANAIVDGRGGVHLIDFGLAAAETQATMSGTLAYIAPEILSAGAVNRRADLYALGITLWEMLTGELPSGGSSGQALIDWHLAPARPSLRERLPGAPAALDGVVARLIARDPERRYPTAAEAAAALEPFAAARRGAPRAGVAGAGAAGVEAGAALVVAAPRGDVERLDEALRRRLSRAGGSAVIEVVGEPGSGKSTLLTEFTWRAELAGVEVVRGDAGARDRPFGAIGAALEQVAALIGEEPPANLKNAATPMAALARWLAVASERAPLVVVLDDLDFADDASRALVRYLAHATPAPAPLLVVASRRPRPDEHDAAAAHTGGVPSVRLVPLAAAEVASLVRAAAGRVDDKLAARVHEHTGGNLLHVVETLRALAARGFPPAGSLGEIALPARIEERIAEELGGAPAAERELLKALAVVGRPATRELLADVVGDKGSDRVARAVAAAIARGLLVADAAGRVRFAQPATRQAIYQRIAPERRRELHAACAAALDRAGDGARDGTPASLTEVARHDVLGGDRARASTRGLAALAALEAAGDHAAALELCQGILELVEAAPIPRRGSTGKRGARAPAPLARSLRLRLGELARLLGDAPRAKAALQPLLDAPGGDDDEVDRARVTLGRALDEAGDTAAAEKLLAAAASTRPGSAQALVAARELARLLHVRLRRPADALKVAEDAITAAPRGAPVHDLHAASAYARGVLGHADAQITLDAAVAAAAAAGDAMAEATAGNWAGGHAFRSGDYPGARRRYQAALAAAERAGDVVRGGIIRMNTASLHFHSGEYAACLEQLSAAASVLWGAGAEAPGLWARRNLAHLLVELGQYEQARADLHAVERDAGRLGIPMHQAAAAALLGITAARGGDLRTARGEIERGRGVYEKIGDGRSVAETLLDRVEVELDAHAGSGSDSAGDLAAAAAALAAAQRDHIGESDTMARARRLALTVELAARRRDLAGVRTSVVDLSAATDAVEARGGRHLLWRLHAALAVASDALDAGAVAAQHRARAADILAAMAAELPAERRPTFWQDPRRKPFLAAATQPPARSKGIVMSNDLRPSRTFGAADTIPGPPSRDETDRLYRLVEIYRRMSSERDRERLLELVMDTAVELTGAERGFLLLADDDAPSTKSGPALRVAVARNLPAAALSETDSGQYSRSIAERVFRTGDPVISVSAREDPRFDRAQSVHALHLESVLCIPVHARGRVAGVLYMESRFQRGRFSPEDLRLVSAFGDQVAIALENARLLDENQRRADALAKAHGEIEALLGERTRLLAERTEELAVARRDLDDVRRRLYRGTGVFGIVGRSPGMERVFHLIEKLAATDVPVLIQGESGTGKELVARALHEQGLRRKKQLVSVNCGALPETLLESELFGHVRGAFTGADRTRRGLFQTADGGTLFLDEIGDTPLRMQVTLLRALQDKTIRLVGGNEDIKVDARVIAATNRSLDAMVAQGKFRQDLFYRLNVVRIHLPALRERREDIPLLVDYFLDVIAARMGAGKKGVTRAAMKKLVDHAWPGNVRQLEHTLTNACVMADGEVLDGDDFVLILAEGAPGSPRRAAPTVAEERLEKEKARIVAALEDCGWNRSKACQQLGMPRRTFYRRLAEYGIV